MKDGDLLRRFDQHGDEAAFADLVARHLDLVHATALRRLRDPHAAADVSQAVFGLLLRKARGLQHLADLAGWLHRATCFKAAEHLRAERRRHFHEHQAASMHLDSRPDPDPWAALAPHLDEALNRLSEPDRQLLFGRFYRRRSLRELGVDLDLSEDAARMRVARALERLRKQLARFRTATAPGSLAGWLEAQLAAPAPEALRALIIERARVARLRPGAVTPSGPGGESLAWILARPAASLGIGLALLICVPLAVWGLHQLFSQGRTDNPKPAIDIGVAAAGRPTALPGARITSVEARPTSAVALNALLDELRRILGSAVQDNVWPPEDLRRSIHALVGHPDATFAVLTGEFHNPASLPATRERALWGMWLLGSEVPGVVPAIVTELAGIVRSPDASAYWWHAASVLYHLGPPEAAPAAVHAALQENPAAALATLRFWEIAAKRQPETVRTLLDPWLQTSGARQFVAASSLARLPDSNRETLLPILAAALDDPAHQWNALDTLEVLGPDAARLAPDLRARFAAAAAKGEVALKQKLADALAAVAPHLRDELPELGDLLRLREEAEALRQKIESDSASVLELAAGLHNPKVGWMAALTLEELGPQAAEALPALRGALVAPGQRHAHYLAKAIKAIDPASPKPLFERDELLATLRGVAEITSELSAALTVEQREQIDEFIRDIQDTPADDLPGFASQLGIIHPRLREVFVGGLIELDPTLSSVLTP